MLTAHPVDSRSAGFLPAADAGRPAAVQLRDLTKSYGPVRAVRGIELEIDPGEIVAMLGPNGAGKSTTNELILGIVEPDRGQARVFGLEPRAAVVAGRVGAMLQSGALLADAKVREVLRLMHGLHPDPLPIGEVVERADLSSFLNTKTEKLSGGQAQRLRYALAILPDPDLLILDEPTVAMDVEIRRHFWASMRDFTSGGKTVLFATHYLDEADDVADRIVVLAEGRIVADGTGAQIKSRVAGRTIAVDVDSCDVSGLDQLAGVVGIDLAGSRVLIHTTDSDETLRALLTGRPGVRDIEITSAKLEDAFLALTGRDRRPAAAGNTDHTDHTATTDTISSRGDSR